MTVSKGEALSGESIDVVRCDDRCPLCDHSKHSMVHRDAARGYFRCAHCSLIFVPAAERPTAAAEKARYDLHRNDPDDAGYRRFLAPLAEAIRQATPFTAVGLDFGCGPGPALARMLRADGRTVVLYDPFYAPDETVWSRTYDFIAASEVFEHLHRPAFQLDQLFSVLHPGGVLAVMTGFVPPTRAEFATWHYISDSTHVCFYDRPVFEYIAARWGASAEFPAPNVVVLRRIDRA